MNKAKVAWVKDSCVSVSLKKFKFKTNPLTQFSEWFISCKPRIFSLSVRKKTAMTRGNEGNSQPGGGDRQSEKSKASEKRKRSDMNPSGLTSDRTSSHLSPDPHQVWPMMKSSLQPLKDQVFTGSSLKNVFNCPVPFVEMFSPCLSGSPFTPPPRACQNDQPTVSPTVATLEEDKNTFSKGVDCWAPGWRRHPWSNMPKLRENSGRGLNAETSAAYCCPRRPQFSCFTAISFTKEEQKVILGVISDQPTRWSGLAPLKSFSPAELWWLYEKNFGKSFPMPTGYNIFATDGRSEMPPFIQLKVWNLITKHGRRMSIFFYCRVITSHDCCAIFRKSQDAWRLAILSIDHLDHQSDPIP